MAQIFEADYNSNTYFFLTSFSDILKAGKNSFTVNTTPYVIPNTPITVSVYDTKNNLLPSGVIKPTNALFSEQTLMGQLYYVNVSKDTINGIGKIEIKGSGLNLGEYTGSIAYYNNVGYKIAKDQRLPLTSAPSEDKKIETVEVVWSRNLLIDTSKKTDSEVRFFASPYIRTRSEVYSLPSYPTNSHRLFSGSFSSIALSPKNNANGDYDYQFEDASYQLYWKSGNKFSASMEGENIRLKNPTVTKFTYTNFGDNRVEYQGVLNTDFIAKIKRVVNETSLLLDIPFATVSELTNLTNEDSPYAKNNLVQLKGYTVIDDASKQTVFHKKNFYVLSLSDGQYEIFHKQIPVSLPRAAPSGSTYIASALNIECNNARTLCGDLSYYKIYGRSLNTPISKTLLTEGKIEAEHVIRSKKFDNGLYDNTSYFYSNEHVNKHWFIKGACMFSQSNEVLINGARISHSDNSSLSDYVIFKDNTFSGSTDFTYYGPNLLPNSYWYANTDAFINYGIYPTASYLGINNIPYISNYSASQENLINGQVHDSNPIRLRQNTLYKFSMKVKAGANNSNDAKLYTYYISGTNKKMIGYIDSSYNFGANESYEKTFFNEQESFGTILLAPSKGEWNISDISIQPYQNIDYSIDSFSVKIPLPVKVPNELYEVEMELYDAQNRLAYGSNSYTFAYNKRFMPLKSKIFVDPFGIAVASDVPFNTFLNPVNNIGGTVIDIVIDGGDAVST